MNMIDALMTLACADTFSRARPPDDAYRYPRAYAYEDLYNTIAPAVIDE